MTYEVPKWLEENHSETIPTKVQVSLAIKVGPVWSYKTNTEGTGGWYGAIVLVGVEELDIADLWTCDHGHEEKANAWVCAASALMQLAETLQL